MALMNCAIQLKISKWNATAIANSSIVITAYLLSVVLLVMDRGWTLDCSLENVSYTLSCAIRVFMSVIHSLVSSVVSAISVADMILAIDWISMSPIWTPWDLNFSQA